MSDGKEKDLPSFWIPSLTPAAEKEKVSKPDSKVSHFGTVYLLNCVLLFTEQTKISSDATRNNGDLFISQIQRMSRRLGNQCHDNH